MDTILSLTNISKTYGSKKILCDINFSLRRGDICGLVGANGAGKTTLMRIILGFTVASKGSVKLNTNQAGSLGGFIEKAVLDDNMTVAQNLECHKLLCGYSQEDKEDVINLFSLKSYLYKKAKQLSLGMRQKVALAQAMMGMPELILLDEPTNGLDPLGVKELREVIISVNRNYNTTFLISSHILDELVKVVTQCALLNNGEITYLVADDKPLTASAVEKDFLSMMV